MTTDELKRLEEYVNGVYDASDYSADAAKDAALLNTALTELLRYKTGQEGCEHVYYIYALKSPERDANFCPDCGKHLTEET